MNTQQIRGFWASCGWGMAMRGVLALALTAAAAQAQSAGGTFYTSFGQNSGGIFPPSAFSNNYSCVTGALSPGCGNALFREVGAPFRPSSTARLGNISLALATGNVGTNGVIVSLTLDAGGTPGNPLESWTVTSLPPSSQPALTTLNDQLNLTLTGAQAYWVTVQPMAADTYVLWYTNVLGMTGAMVNNGSGWSLLSGIVATQPAFSVMMSRTGALSHIAAGGGWTTVITLINPSAANVQTVVNFFADDGSYLNQALTTTLSGATQSYTSANQVTSTLPPGATLQISMGGATGTTAVGWAQVYSTGPLSGYAIFRQTPPSGATSEGTVPLETQAPYSIALSYDNTAAFVMGVALANLSPTPQTISVAITDNNGNLLGTQTISIAANGHTSFVLPTQFPVTGNRMGVLQFSGNGNLSGLGLRFSPFGTFTSVPTAIVAPTAQ